MPQVVSRLVGLMNIAPTASRPPKRVSPHVESDATQQATLARLAGCVAPASDRTVLMIRQSRLRASGPCAGPTVVTANVARLQQDLHAELRRALLKLIDE